MAKSYADERAEKGFEMLTAGGGGIEATTSMTTKVEISNGERGRIRWRRGWIL